jgi:hypothetical protein
VSVLSTLLDSLLPNGAWNRRVKDLHDSRSRILYWTLRIGLTIALLLVLWFFGIQQHPQLR